MKGLRRIAKHRVLLLIALVLLGALGVMVASGFNLAAVIPISVFLGAIPLAISQSIQGICKDIVAGQQLRAEGVLREGMRIHYNGEDSTVADLRLRTAILKTERGRAVAAYSLLLNGFEIIEGDPHAA